MADFDINDIEDLKEIRRLAEKYKGKEEIPDSEKDLKKAFLAAKAKYYMDETVSPDYFEKRILGIKKAEDLDDKLKEAGIDPKKYKAYVKQYKEAAIARDKGEEYEFPELNDKMIEAIRKKLGVKAPKPIEDAILEDKRSKNWLNGKVTESTLKSFDRQIKAMDKAMEPVCVETNPTDLDEPPPPPQRKSVQRA